MSALFTIWNAVVIALLQIGVIVAGILAAGIVQRVWKSNELSVPAPVIALTSYGFVGLAAPLLWIVLAVWIRQREDVPNGAKSAVFALGILMLLAILAFVGYAVISPWSYVDWRLGGPE